MSSIFQDVRDYVAVPRTASLRLAPDGSRLVAVTQSLNPDKKSYGTALYDIPLEPGGEATRLTRSAKGEGGAVFTAGGDLLFVSARPDPTEKDDNDKPALWLLPKSGEPRRLATRPGGIAGVKTGGSSIVYVSDVLPGDQDTEKDRRKEREEAGITAILHEGYPVRFWDHDIGPAHPRFFSVEHGELTPDVGDALHRAAFDVTPDGATVITTWRENVADGEHRNRLVALTAGERRILASDDGFDFEGPVVISPDGGHVVCHRERITSETVSGRVELWLVDLKTGEQHPLGEGAASIAWAPDSTSLYVSADHGGRRPIFHVSLGGEWSRITLDDGAYAELNVAPDGTIYALRGAIDSPHLPAKITRDAGDAYGAYVTLPAPTPVLDVPGTLTEVFAVADDGTEIRAWLVLPVSERPAPLLLWIHGGPVNSWNDWSWRWNPWIMAAKGYAVLLPDPAMSTGYGQAMIDRGWGEWGPVTHGDLMAITDAACKLPEVDETRTAAMGGSFGGYMANWVAGHTDRFKAIVTHASLWNLDQFAGTTDVSSFWQREFGPPGSDRYLRLSPHHSLDQITTPMLVIHGDKDYRVPIGEALRLWWDLQRTGAEAKFLYFPDENHWVLKPGNSIAWYETVLAFLAVHVLGEEWRRPGSVA
ncbi:S9 family peptidase [Herbidospora mongoliensis]|uniref:S9 family peptidase n=1 Tax=Herbidospora mongoliensis TaxID=688067 RepID=UPI0008372A2A|nr:S9 family peptidase [Herbidospora mongoliensis]